LEILKEQIRSIVGPEHLVCDARALAPYYAESIAFVPERPPLFAARPGTVDELRCILTTANLNRVPVTPFSSAQNGYGGSIPSIPGITIDLRRQNAIHSIDVGTRNAIIEPGVTFGQLQAAAKANGLRVLTPVELPCDSSVISTYVDMAPLYAWPRYGTETILTMEVMLPNGEILKTGIGAIPVVDKPYFPFGSIPAYLNKIWFGAQGTLGIVTRAVVKLKTDFESKEVLFIPFPSLPATFAALREFKRLDYPVESFLVNATYLASLLASDGADFIALQKDLPPVTAVLVLRGEEPEVAYQKEDLHDLGKKLDLGIHDSLPGRMRAREQLLDEIAMPEGYVRFRRLKGGYASIPFICMTAQIPVFTRVIGQITQAFGYDMRDIGELLVPVEPARVHFQYSLYYDPANPKEKMVARKVFEALSATLIKMGAFFSRPYGSWASQVYEKASLYKTVLRDIKQELDPQRIMNPGKLDL